MNVSHMKNIIVLKDLPSNIVEEAIVILKSGSKIKNEKVIDAKSYKSNFTENSEGNYETAIKEAEFLVADYMKKIEKTNENTPSIRKMKIQYQKLKVCSVLLGIVAIIGVIISIIKWENWAKFIL